MAKHRSQTVTEVGIGSPPPGAPVEVPHMTLPDIGKIQDEQAAALGLRLVGIRCERIDFHTPIRTETGKYEEALEAVEVFPAFGGAMLRIGRLYVPTALCVLLEAKS